jgi:hypothetical protein
MLRFIIDPDVSVRRAPAGVRRPEFIIGSASPNTLSHPGYVTPSSPLVPHLTAGPRILQCLTYVATLCFIVGTGVPFPSTAAFLILLLLLLRLVLRALRLSIYYCIHILGARKSRIHHFTLSAEIRLLFSSQSP